MLTTMVYDNTDTETNQLNSRDYNSRNKILLKTEILSIELSHSCVFSKNKINKNIIK